MIKTITVTNHLSDSVVLDLRNPEQSGFFIRGIDGLGPGKATINTTESLNLDGSRHNSSRLGERNIVFNLGFLGNPTIEDTRQNSYKYFPIKTLVEILFETDNKTTKISGYIESNEPDIFSKEEGCTISIICTDPFFYSLSNTVINFSSVISLFSFPFSNESLTEKLIDFGSVVAYPQETITYLGDAPIGVKMYVHLLENIDQFTIYNIETREFIKIYSDVVEFMTGKGLTAGEDIVISTIKGEKSILLIRDGEYINILNALSDDSSWLFLEKGANTFYYSSIPSQSDLQFRIEYLDVYEGI